MTNHKSPEFNPANFPALRAFLRGYFHEDVVDEYETPVEAARQFCQDADPEERNAVAHEWRQIEKLVEGHSELMNEALRKLGSAIRLEEDEIAQVAAVFGKYGKAKRL